jgi:hypothetical protein
MDNRRAGLALQGLVESGLGLIQPVQTGVAAFNIHGAVDRLHRPTAGLSRSVQLPIMM